MAESNHTPYLRPRSIFDRAEQIDAADTSDAAETLRLIRARARRYRKIMQGIRAFNDALGVAELFGHIGSVTERVEIHGARFHGAAPRGWIHYAGDPAGIYHPDVDTEAGRAFQAVLDSWRMGEPDDIYAASGTKPKLNHHAPRIASKGAAPDLGGSQVRTGIAAREPKYLNQQFV